MRIFLFIYPKRMIRHCFQNNKVAYYLVYAPNEGNTTNVRLENATCNSQAVLNFGIVFVVLSSDPIVL